MKTFSMKPRDNERLHTSACPVCGGKSVRRHWECGTYRFVRCTGCGLIYQNPQPHFDDLRLRYDREYFEYERANEERFFSLMMLGLSDVGFFEIEPAWRERGSFLDVGCATGRLLGEMKARGWRVCGVEICAPAAAYGRTYRDVDIRTGSLEESALSDESVAVAHFSHVIEHVPDPHAFLAEIYRVIEPGGYVIIVTPDSGGFQARLFGGGWRSAIADHLHLFSAATLSMLCVSIGFEVVRKRSWGGLAEGTAPRWLKSLVDPLAKKLNVGDVMALLCRKPAA